MALDKLKYTYQDPSKVSQLNVDDVLNVTNTINTTTLNTTTVNSKAEVISPAIGTSIALTTKPNNQQTSDLIQNQNLLGTPASGINAAGHMYFGSSSVANSFYSHSIAIISATALSSTIATYTLNINFQFVASGSYITVVNMLPSYFNGTFIVQSVSGSGNIYTYTVYNSAGTFIPGGVATTLGQTRPHSVVSITSPTPYQVPLSIRGHASQSYSLTEWQNSSGTNLARMDNAGNLQLTALWPNRIQDAALTGAQIVPVSNTSNLFNSSGMLIRALGANQQALTVRSSFTVFTITAATANGTTITYTTSSDPNFIYAGMGVTITGVVSTGNLSATAGTGFNLTGATIASVTGSQFTITNSLVDTYTSGGVATATTTGDIQQWQNGNSSVVARVTSAGGAAFTGNTVISGGLLVQGNYGGTNTMAIANNQNIIGLTITANSTQTANLQEWRNNSGGLLAYVTSTGSSFFGGNVISNGNYYGLGLMDPNSSGAYIAMNSNTNNTINTGVLRIRPRAANGLPLVIQSTNTSGSITAAIANGTTITYTTNVAGFLVAGQSITITGVVSSGNPGATSGSGFNLTSATIATVSPTQFTVTNSLVDTYTSGGSLVVAPTADLTQWQDQNGNIRAYINNVGAFVSNQLIGTAGYLYSVAPASFGSNGLNNTYQVQVVNGTAARIGLMVQGAASQSADLMQWQNSSSTVLSAIDIAGNFTKGDGDQLLLAGQIF